MAVLLVIFGFVVLIALLMVVKGFVLTYLWSWFITPFGLPELGLAHAIGVAMVVSYLTHQIETPDKDNPNAGFEKLGYHFVGSLLVFCIGWIVFKFMY